MRGTLWHDADHCHYDRDIRFCILEGEVAGIMISEEVVASRRQALWPHEESWTRAKRKRAMIRLEEEHVP